MELPEIVCKAGVVEDNRIVYIEDYALQYLKILKQEENVGEDKYILYGRKEQAAGKEIYIIYGAGRPDEEDELGFKDVRKGYERIGRLDMTSWKQEKEIVKGLVMGTGGNGQPVKGYYIFYDADEKMKDCLSKYYEGKINRSRYTAHRGRLIGKQAELVALCSNEQTSGVSLYIWIRIVVIGILAVFCAIAVITINDYDKISDFVQAAVQTTEMIEEP